MAFNFDIDRFRLRLPDYSPARLGMVDLPIFRPERFDFTRKALGQIRSLEVEGTQQSARADSRLVLRIVGHDVDVRKVTVYFTDWQYCLSQETVAGVFHMIRE